MDINNEKGSTLAERKLRPLRYRVAIIKFFCGTRRLILDILSEKK